MIKQYMKQAWFLLKENKLLSAISILGTALAIAMIMVIVIVIRSQSANFAPETNRDRMLLMHWISIQYKNNLHGTSTSPMSWKTIREVFKDLETAEAVSGFTIFPMSMLVSLQASSDRMSVDVQQTDADFWKVFEFSFLAGRAYDETDFDSGLPRAVISEDVARRLFGTTDVAGRTFLLNHAEYTVSGVVRNVSMLAAKAYAQVWVPITSTGLDTSAWDESMALGMFQVVILAHSSSDFPAIREEVERRRMAYEQSLEKFNILFHGMPDTYFVDAQHGAGNQPSRAGEVIRMYIITIIVLLIVPAVNLSGLTLSRMRKRISEIGVRKAFGATRGGLMIQILSENLFYSLLGGIVGLGLSYFAALSMNDMLFGSGMTASLAGENAVNATFLLSPAVFGLAFLFCLVLNLLSAGIPAWRTARKSVIDSLNER